MKNKVFAVAAAIRIGADIYKAPVFVLLATNEEAAEADALNQICNAFHEMYGVAEGQGFEVLHFSAEEVPISFLQGALKAISPCFDT